MMILVTGGSGSGKSSYAENVAGSLAEDKNFLAGEIKKYYLATMKIYDEEGRRKVDRHQKKRYGKGFLTIEQPTDICRALEKMKIRTETETGIALLEDIANLTANEMFSEDKVKKEEDMKISARPEIQIAEKIVREIGIVRENLTHLVIVSNNVFEDGITYDEATMSYIRAMGYINQKLAAMADEVTEIVAGIPIMLKD